MRLTHSILGLFLAVSIGAQAQAAQSCRRSFIDEILSEKQVSKKPVKRHAAVPKGLSDFVIKDAYMQWLKWEQTANVKQFQKSQEAIELPIAFVPKNLVTVESSPDALRGFVKTLTNSRDQIAWFKHPWNKHAATPFHDSKAWISTPAYLTASRSLVLADPKFRGLSVKLPTDHPHGPNGEYQPGKADTADDVMVAITHSNHIKNMDKKLGPDEKMVMLPEVLTISEVKTKIGMVVRDLRQMDDGHYYLPALSIPYVGRRIAEHNGQSFEVFWQKHYAELLGESKAKLLLRYGIQMETPNAQNMLIQLDRDMRPTGRLVFRDVSDAVFVKGVAEGLGFETLVKQDIAVDFKPHTYIKPYWSNSSWRFNEAGALSVPDKALSDWGRAHNAAYVHHLAKELGLDPAIFKHAGKNDHDSMPEVYELFQTKKGQALLNRYRPEK